MLKQQALIRPLVIIVVIALIGLSVISQLVVRGG
jgi:hypothetical protein